MHTYIYLYLQDKRKTVIVVIQARMSFQIEFSKMIPEKHLMSALQIDHVRMWFIMLWIYNHSICIHMYIVLKILNSK